MLLQSNGPRTFVGRWDAVEGDVVWLNDAAVHTDGEYGVSKSAFLEQLAMLGPTNTVARIAIPLSEVHSVERLGDWKRNRRTYSSD